MAGTQEFPQRKEVIMRDLLSRKRTIQKNHIKRSSISQYPLLNNNKRLRRLILKIHHLECRMERMLCRPTTFKLPSHLRIGHSQLLRDRKVELRKREKKEI